RRTFGKSKSLIHKTFWFVAFLSRSLFHMHPALPLSSKSIVEPDFPVPITHKMSIMKINYFLFLALILSGPIVFAQWTNFGLPGFSPGGLSNWQDIEIDSNNTVYVSFNDEGLPAGQGTVMKYTGSQWTTVGNA